MCIVLLSRCLDLSTNDEDVERREALRLMHQLALLCLSPESGDASSRASASAPPSEADDMGIDRDLSFCQSSFFRRVLDAICDHMLLVQQPGFFRCAISSVITPSDCTVQYCTDTSTFSSLRELNCRAQREPRALHRGARVCAEERVRRGGRAQSHRASLPLDDLCGSGARADSRAPSARAARSASRAAPRRARRPPPATRRTRGALCGVPLPVPPRPAPPRRPAAQHSSFACASLLIALICS